MEQKVKNLTKFDYRTMKYCNLYIIKYKRHTFLVYAIMAAITIGFSIWSFVSSLLDENEGTNYLFPIIFILFAVYMLYQGLNVEKSLDRQLEAYFANKPVTEQIVEISEETIKILSRGLGEVEANPIDVDWSQVTEIHEIPEYYFLLVGKNTPLIIDKSSEAFLEGSLEELKAIIDEKAKAKPYKHVDKNIVKRPITYVHQVFEEKVEKAEFVESKVEDTPQQETDASVEVTSEEENK